MKQLHRLVIVALLLSTLLGVSLLRAAAQDSLPIVHAVLFYSPSCTHCQYVINEVLPPLTHKYGPQLQIIGFDVTQPQGEAMFYSALDRLGLQQPSVPLLVIDNIALTGSEEIPDKFPALIESYLKLGGVAWPDIPGLRDMLVAAAQTATAEATGPSGSAQPTMQAPATGLQTAQPEPPDWRVRFSTDVTANSIAVALLVGMLGAVVWALMRFRRATGPLITNRVLTWLIPGLCLLGLIVAGYLTYVEATNASAVCGPIGDCNTVQQSRYSHLFGVLSIGAFGLIGYTLIIVAWVIARVGRAGISSRATFALFVLAFLGTLVSIYLTFLEPFVIGATCAWCLTSAALMTSLMLLTAGPAGMALQESRRGATSLMKRTPKPHKSGSRGKRSSSGSRSR